MVLLNHARQELAHHEEMRDGVDLEGLTDLGLWFLENRAIVADARVVDENCGIAMLCADLLCDFGDAGGRSDIGLEECGAGCCIQSVNR
jgi:hypothetical protein